MLAPHQAQAVAVVRTLKGPPLTLFIIMRILNRPTTQHQLVALTGHSRKTIQAGLELLAALGYATRDHYRSWQLTPHAQMILPGPEAGVSPASAPTTATTSLQLSDRTMTALRSGVSDPAAAAVPAPTTSPLARLDDMLQDAHIGQPLRGQLLALDHMDGAWVAAHIAHATATRTATGLLIHRLKHNDPWPADYRNKTLHCTQCHTTTPWEAMCHYCYLCPACHPEEPCLP